MSSAWPALSFEQWSETCDTLHAHTQLLGKLAVVLAPPEPQLQHAALRLSARGWETLALPAPDRSGALVIALDLQAHEVAVEHSDGRNKSEAALRRHAVAVRTKPLWLDAIFEGDGGRTSVSWIGPIYPPAPLEYPGTDGSGVAGYRYRYRIGDGRWTAWQRTKQPGFVLLHTHKGEKLDLYVQPIDDAGVLRKPARAIITVTGPTLTAENPGGSEPGEYGKAELKPEP